MLILIPTTITRCPHCNAVIDRSFFDGLRIDSPDQRCKCCGRMYRDGRCCEWAHLSTFQQICFRVSNIFAAVALPILLPIGAWFLSLFERKLIPMAHFLAVAYPFIAAIAAFLVNRNIQRKVAHSTKRTTPPPLPPSEVAISNVQRNRVPATLSLHR